MTTTTKARYKVTHTTTYNYSEAVPVCHNEVHLSPREHSGQRCAFTRLLIKPAPTGIERRVDYFGNHVSSFAIQEGHHRLSVTAISRVEVTARPKIERSPPWEDVRDFVASDCSAAGLEACSFRFESPHVVLLPELQAYSSASFAPGRPIVEAAQDLMRRIYSEFKYDPSATTVNTPLGEVLRLKRGVCQDFAHLAIGCLRARGLAARYVSGYLLTMPPPGQPRLVGADASHAWLAIFCGPELGWVDFDPTNNVIPTTHHVTLAWGRDYSDVCPIKGVFVGGGHHWMSVSVDVAPLSCRAEKNAANGSAEDADASPDQDLEAELG